MEDGVIDLTDVAVEETEIENDITDRFDDSETDIDIGEDIIDFTEITDDFDGRDTKSDTRLVQQPDSLDTDFVDSLGMDLTSDSEEKTESFDTDLKNEETIEEFGIALDREDTSSPSVIGDTEPALDDIFKTQPGEATPPNLSGIPAEQLEEILKRIVDEMFSEKIEQMLTTFIEKAVAREIERLKEILLEDSSGM
ncbi:MAG: hypothetical protein B6I22_02310 [Desulfobacteraceae bacterium 4572_123]|nr:MAG: hypothetical protein B6I22_02310 [Desulfobacteraceae bacterium 4572_123]